MKTKEKIILKSLELFNNKGVRNVTLREVAKELEKSYGNITYHFKTKEEVIKVLYELMVKEQDSFNQSFFFKEGNLLQKIIEGPLFTFELSLKYLFFYKDFIELQRAYPVFYEQVEERKNGAMKVFQQILLELQKDDYLRQDLKVEDLDYLMQLSGAMRLFFFLNQHQEKGEELKQKYFKDINKLLYPYLSKKGIEIYQNLVS